MSQKEQKTTGIPYRNFAVVDVETTGGYAAKNRIIEIGIVVVEEGIFKEQYQSYVNPETEIPYFITTLTGITNQDVEKAPVFAEIAQKVKFVLGNHIFVAHNVNFDYSFVKKEFDLLKIPFEAKRLCTARYAKASKLNVRSNSLKSLVDHFDIINENPHRALSDAVAAAKILNFLQKRDAGLEVLKKLMNRNETKVTLPIHVNSKDFANLTNKAGVYFFKDHAGKPLYIGKAKNIKSRVSSHFNGDLKRKKIQHFIRDIYKIDFKETGSELLALLLEDYLIREHWPKYNVAQKHNAKKFGVVKYQDQNQNWRLTVQPIKQSHLAIKWFYTNNAAQLWLHQITEQFELNPNYTGIFSMNSEMAISDETHQLHFNLMLKSDVMKEQTIFIVEKGRRTVENTYIKCVGNKVQGYSFGLIDGEPFNSFTFENQMQMLKSSATSEKIIENYLAKENIKVIVE